ncbi:hypothetical protein [Desulfofundulus sp.]|uniref:hypothetical protein n=1 Tax=Desulfofundulus sp. TaxID=2282750 RepID=UPI003C78A389
MKLKVVLTDHAIERWRERAGREPGDLENLLRVLLKNRLAAGLEVRKGRALLPLDAEDLDLPEDLIACLDLPSEDGTWPVLTFLRGGEHMNRKEKTEYKAVMLHPFERLLIDFLRRVRKGKVEVQVKDGLPVFPLRRYSK